MPRYRSASPLDLDGTKKDRHAQSGVGLRETAAFKVIQVLLIYANRML
jgi:hypothetical protein